MKLTRWIMGILLVASLPCSLAAQSATSGAIAGVVKDATGAVLPGVTVEASSPALIEKVRTVVTDGEGNYRIVDLRPGTYAVSFALAGFGGVKREGIELTSGFTAAVNAELKVGDLNETITVSGASPVVDVQNSRVQTVLSQELLKSAPAGQRDMYSFAALTVGARASAATQDVGGSNGSVCGAPAYHGLNASDSRYKLDGMDYNSLNGVGGGGANLYHPNQMAVSEVNVGLGGQGAEYETAGVQINMVPKEGGNRVSLTGVADYMNEHFQGTNLSDEIQARGLRTVGKLEGIWDYGAVVGGPIRKDKLWFLVSPRWWGSDRRLAGAYYNATQHTPFYTPDLSRPVVAENWFRDYAGRLTWQVNQSHKVTGSHSEQRSCFCAFRGAPTQAPEYFVTFEYVTRVTQATWTYPATNRLLFQGGVSRTVLGRSSVPTGDVLPTDISTSDVGTGLLYRATFVPVFSTSSGAMYSEGNRSNPLTGRFSVAYVTGSHSFKVGLSLAEGWHNETGRINESLQYVFLNRQPISLTQFADPFSEQLRVRSRAVYAQDQWTMNRLTLNLGVRFDYFKGWVREQVLPAGRFVPERRFAAVDNVPNFKDITPRLGASYNLFGGGRTAVKGSVGRYVFSLAAGLPEQNNPAVRMVTATTRTWNDGNGNYAPDCVLTNFAANGECGAIGNNLFGTVVPGTTYADDMMRGWGQRVYSWQTSVSLQQELRPGLSLTVGYFHNWIGNILASVNQRVTAADFTSYCVTAPQDPRLPGGGGYQVCGNHDVNPDKFGQVSTLIEPASDLGVDVSRVFNGVDLSVSGRFGNGGLLSGGVSAGRTVLDDCALNAFPQAFATGNGFIENGGDTTLGGAVHPLSSPYCHVAPPWAKSYQLKLNGVYPLPYGFELGGVFQNLPGLARLANLTYTNAQVAPSLGRNLAAGPNATVTIPILAPQTSYENRLSQIDLRLTRIFTVGTTRLKPSFSVYNLFNANTITGVNNTYGATWLQPQSVMPARFAKVGVQIDF